MWISLNRQCTVYVIYVCHVFQSGIGIRVTSAPSAEELNTWMCVVFTFNQNRISGVTDRNILHPRTSGCPAISKWFTSICLYILSRVFWFVVFYFCWRTMIARQVNVFTRLSVILVVQEGWGVACDLFLDLIRLVLWTSPYKKSEPAGKRSVGLQLKGLLVHGVFSEFCVQFITFSVQVRLY